MRINRKRLLVGASAVTALGAAATLVAGVTLGLFSSQAGSGNSTFSSGTVSVTNDASSAPCGVTNLVPGDTSSNNGHSACTFVIDDGSSVAAYAAVDVFIASGKASSVGSTYGSTSTVTPSDLYDGSNSTGLNVTIKDGNNKSFTVPVTANAVSCAGIASTDPFYAAAGALSSPSADSCYEIQDLLLSTTAVGPSGGTISTLTVTWSLPGTAGNAYEGGDALIAMNAHEVQSRNNGIDCLSGTPTVGAQCSPTGTFRWS